MTTNTFSFGCAADGRGGGEEEGDVVLLMLMVSLRRIRNVGHKCLAASLLVYWNIIINRICKMTDCIKMTSIISRTALLYIYKIQVPLINIMEIMTCAADAKSELTYLLYLVIIMSYAFSAFCSARRQNWYLEKYGNLFKCV